MTSAGLRRLVPAGLLALATVAACAPAAQAYRLDGIPWPGRPATITYWNGTSYGAELGRAVAAWNASGARVRFKPASRRRAQLRVVYDERAELRRYRIAHGIASVGYQPRNRIALGRGARGAGAIGVIAHELGHVLGLVHEDRRCAVMSPVPWSSCLPSPSCSILQRDDIRGAISRYGGRLRSPLAELCPPPPAALAVGRTETTGQLVATVTLPQGDIAGVVTRRAVGRCPERPTGVAEGRDAAAGAIVRVDVTPRGTLVSLDRQVLCVRAWTYDPTGRVSADPATQEFVLPAVAGA